MEGEIDHIRMVVGGRAGVDVIRRIYLETKSVEDTIEIIFSGEDSTSNVKENIKKVKVPKRVTESTKNVKNSMEIIDLTEPESQHPVMDVIDAVPASLSPQKTADQEILLVDLSEYEERPAIIAPTQPQVQTVPAIINSTSAAAPKPRTKQSNKTAKNKEEAHIKNANKPLADKKISVQEMIVVMDMRIDPIILTQCQAHLNENSISVALKELKDPNTVCWVRKCSRTWDMNTQRFQPTRSYPYREKICVKLLSASSLVSLIRGDCLDSNAKVQKLAFPGYRITYLIYSLHSYLSSVRKETAGLFKQGKSYDCRPAGRPEIEAALLRLQVKHDCYTICVEKDEHVADWLLIYTRELSIGPYEQSRMRNNMPFSISDMGTCGKTDEENWRRMLQQILKLTPAIAECLAQRFPTFKSLWNTVTGMRKSEALAVLENIPVSRSITTSSQNVRRLGPTLAERIFTMMTSTNSGLLIND